MFPHCTGFANSQGAGRSVVQLFNEGNTVPFITRYRKERTGGLDEEVIRQIQTRLNFLKQLNERKQTILAASRTRGN